MRLYRKQLGRLPWQRIVHIEQVERESRERVKLTEFKELRIVAIVDLIQKRYSLYYANRIIWDSG